MAENAKRNNKHLLKRMSRQWQLYVLLMIPLAFALLFKALAQILSDFLKLQKLV